LAIWPGRDYAFFALWQGRDVSGESGALVFVSSATTVLITVKSFQQQRRAQFREPFLFVPDAGSYFRHGFRVCAVQPCEAPSGGHARDDLAW
jgi:hypothetical protein|tara:strand:+ start:6912 stop:7187 length:276 start_codon:yes stop_codon:yes gene_type:complete